MEPRFVWNGSTQPLERPRRLQTSDSSCHRLLELHVATMAVVAVSRGSAKVVGHLGGRDPKYTRKKRWLGTFATAEQATHTYNVTSLCYLGSRAKLNFPADTPIAEFLAPPVKVVSRVEEKEHCKAENELEAGHADADYMAELIAKNPQLLIEDQVWFEAKENDEMCHRPNII